MGQALDSVAVVTQHAEVVQMGEKLILPEGMKIESAVEVLLRRMEYFEEDVQVVEEYDVFPWDGARALKATLQRKFGWATAEPTPTFFGPKPPQTISIEEGYGKRTTIIWGEFSLPGVEGRLSCGMKTTNSGRLVFVLSGIVKRKNEEMVKQIMAEIREELKFNSLYRGKALRIRFLNDEGDAYPMPDIRFIDHNAVTPEKLILSRHLYDAVETNLFTPIRRVKELRANGMAIKRGVLLGGTFGTGKTLTAAAAANLAVREGVMYLTVDRADELSRAIEFARQYEDPACVIFCEDIDRVASGDRSIEMDDLLNIVDGIDAKSSNLIVVLTTNEMETINPAMLRPGRLDAVIEVTTPDAEAIERLLRLYGRDVIPEDTDLSAVGKVLAGNIPAVIEEVVKRAKLAQLKRNLRGQLVDELSVEALLESAETMQGQLNLLARRIAAPKGTQDQGAFQQLVQSAVEGALANGGMAHVQEAVEKGIKHKISSDFLRE